MRNSDLCNWSNVIQLVEKTLKNSNFFEAICCFLNFPWKGLRHEMAWGTFWDISAFFEAIIFSSLFSESIKMAKPDFYKRNSFSSIIFQARLFWVDFWKKKLGKIWFWHFIWLKPHCLVMIFGNINKPNFFFGFFP